jgi:hypothetical protein
VAILHRAYVVDLEVLARELSSLSTHEELIAHAKRMEFRGLTTMSLRVDLRIDEERGVEDDDTGQLGLLMVMASAARRVPSWSELDRSGWSFLLETCRRSGLDDEWRITDPLGDGFNLMVHGRPLRELAAQLPERWRHQLAGLRHEQGGWLDVETALAFVDRVAAWERDSELIADLAADERFWQGGVGRDLDQGEERELLVGRILRLGASMYAAVGQGEVLWMFLD